LRTDAANDRPDGRRTSRWPDKILHTRRPLAGIRGQGHVTLHNGRVPSLALNENLMRLVKFNNQGPAKDNPASFNRISTDLELANLRISSKTIDIDGYGVDVDAAGNVKRGRLGRAGLPRRRAHHHQAGIFSPNTFARFAGATVKDGFAVISLPRSAAPSEVPGFCQGLSGPPR
jgi:hypothetical protein